MKKRDKGESSEDNYSIPELLRGGAWVKCSDFFKNLY